MSSSELAELLGISESAVRHYETGVRRPRTDTAKKIELITKGQVPASELLGIQSSRIRKSGVSEDTVSFLGPKSPMEADLFKEAAIYGLDVDQIARKAVEEAVKAERIRRWNEENREAIESWNELVEREGLWSDGMRAF